MADIYFSDYKVSTITCNVDLNVNIDLLVLFDKFEIGEKSKFIWIYYPKITDRDNKRGVYPKKQRKVKKTTIIKKTSFDNQVTFLYKAENYPNLKIFKNGNIQITGVKNKDDVIKIVDEIIFEIKKIYEINKEITTTDNFLEKIGFYNFKIRMINTDFKTYTDKDFTNKFIIRRKVLHKILIGEEYNNKCSFEPGKYHGVKLEFFWNKKKDYQDGKCECCDNCKVEDEIHFFIVHRLMHVPFFMRHIHKIHHRSLTPTVYSVYSFHPVEALLLSTVPLCLVWFIPLEPRAIMVYPLTSILLNFSGHCNYRFWKAPGPGFFQLGTRHNEHHTRGRSNFGFASSLLDTLYKRFL